MNLPLYIARHNRKDSNTQRPAIRMAVIAMAMGICIMLLTLSIVIGFKREVESKVIGFGAHIQVVNFDNNNSYEAQPIRVRKEVVEQIRAVPGVRSVQPFALKAGMIKTGTEFQPIILKGVTPEFDWDFFSHNLEEGEMPKYQADEASKDVLISRQLARLMGLKLDDSFYCYFIQDKVRARKLHITGIYNTDFADYDKQYIIGDMQQIAQLNQWEADQASGLEVLVDDFKQLDDIGEQVYLAVANQFDEEGNTLLSQTIRQLSPGIFNWLALLDTNVYVIIILMLLVSGFNIISALIILILDGVQDIGILKALGGTNRMIQQIYICQTLFLTGKGLLWGNIIGMALAALQYYTHLLPLDPSAYYVSYVPIAFPWMAWILLNIGTLIVTALMLMGPSYLITRISPAQVMRYE